MEVVVDSPNVRYGDGFLEADYDYLTTRVEKRGAKLVVRFSFVSFLFFLAGFCCGSLPASGLEKSINNI